ncbi:Gfo/Idh/MocA family protein [Capnocytophaga canis]|uniref:Glycosyl hydrolase family 109 protein 2 n=1 Tax=Capnocytophaga canis TaxID=1848903 RepID=A0A0B7IDZ1_9FLAO|nr:Gfo/Idh/MocA family oxidoreductase [Capnocytophaga canis]CEN48178.1 Glycosyl hydrolase family 109 protein 2 [Capnocytophaga canis]CEN52487.1 Glycosyl hydrolase family 109 protein 2 [Capnocytophaga canis]
MTKSVFNLAVAPIENLSIGFIGVGIRGVEALKRYMCLDVHISAICDIYPEYIEKAKKITEKQSVAPVFLSGKEDWKKLCQLPNLDLVYISTPWEMHTEMAVYAMQQGKHVAIEVPLAMTVDDCWKIVKTAEATQRHCMMLENTCYDNFELMTLQMIQKGLLGEIVHGEGAYIHDLRRLNFQQNDRDTLRGEWRMKYSQTHNGNPYPTHGIAPICQAMNILRGDNLTRLVSMSSLAIGMQRYAENTFGKDSPQAQVQYTGDMNLTLIKTALGKTILLQHDATSPRPYSRIFLLSGTDGFVQKYPTPQIYFDKRATPQLSTHEMELYMQENEHPFVKQTAYLRELLPDQKPMDIIMDYRLVYCLKNGLPLDQNVYDGALWSCITELSELSVQNGNIPVEIPDFTKSISH